MPVAVKEGMAHLEVQGQEDRYDLNCNHVSFGGRGFEDHTRRIYLLGSSHRRSEEGGERNRLGKVVHLGNRGDDCSIHRHSHHVYLAVHRQSGLLDQISRESGFDRVVDP